MQEEDPYFMEKKHVSGKFTYGQTSTDVRDSTLAGVVRPQLYPFTFIIGRWSLPGSWRFYAFTAQLHKTLSLSDGNHSKLTHSQGQDELFHDKQHKQAQQLQENRSNNL